MRISDWSSDVCSSDLSCHGMNAVPDSASYAPGCNGQSMNGDSRPTRWPSTSSSRNTRPLMINSTLVTGGRLVNIGILVRRSEEHTSELQSLMRISYAVFCLQTKTEQTHLIKQYNDD